MSRCGGMGRHKGLKFERTDWETAVWMLSNSVKLLLGQRRAKPSETTEGVETKRQPPKSTYIRYGEDIVQTTTSLMAQVTESSMKIPRWKHHTGSIPVSGTT